MSRKNVGELSVGMLVEYEGVSAIIKSFPSRRMVVLESVKPTSGSWHTAKVSTREVSIVD
jgi:hypothetical protein